MDIFTANFIDPWFRWGYFAFYGKFFAAKFEMAPLALVHALVIHHDASRVCPRRLDWQMKCADQKCHDCTSHNQINIADCDVRLTSGLSARTIAAALSLKSAFADL